MCCFNYLKDSWYNPPLHLSISDLTELYDSLCSHKNFVSLVYQTKVELGVFQMLKIF